MTANVELDTKPGIVSPEMETDGLRPQTPNLAPAGGHVKLTQDSGLIECDQEHCRVR